MPQTKSFWEHPVEVLEEALSLKKQIASLQSKLGSLFGGDEPSVPTSVPTSSRGGKRTFSAASRLKMAAAQRARWAKRSGGSATESAPAPAASSTGAKKGGKRTMSPEARARIAEAQRARWAKTKGTASFSGASASSAAAPAKSGRRKKRTISAEGRARIAEAARRRWAREKGK